MRDYQAKVVENKQIAAGIYSITFDLGEEAVVRAGQFGDILVGGGTII